MLIKLARDEVRLICQHQQQQNLNYGHMYFPTLPTRQGVHDVK